VLWALTDNQGSVRMLLDNDGNVVNNITYDAFGNITLETNPEVNFRFSYTGREYDSETGLYNYRSRYYDPESGEFVSEDTIGFAGGDANLSRYVGNNPVNFIDPFGFSGFCRVGSLDDQSTLIAGDITDESGGGIGVDDVVKGAFAAIVGAIGAAIGVISSILEEDSDDDDDDGITVYRVDEIQFPRVEILPDGRVAIPDVRTNSGEVRDLFINVNQRQRAEILLQRRERQNKPAVIKAFEVEPSYVDKLRRESILEDDVKTDGSDKILRVDVNKAPDQFGLRTEAQINDLRNAIIQGTGRIEQ
jgi:RHS repeat-associated protein